MTHGPRDSRRGEDGSSAITVYVAERLLTGIEPGELTAIQRTLAEAARRTSAAGQHVRYLRGTYLPAQGRLICIFEAESEEAIHASTWLAQLPFARVKPAVEVPLPKALLPKAPLPDASVPNTHLPDASVPDAL